MNKSIINQESEKNWSFYNADCVYLTKELPDNSIDFCVYSPPFSSLYIYSESVADMGNVDCDEQFIEQYQFLLNDLHRVTKAGRLHAVHVKDLVYYKNSSKDGTSGLRPFSDMVTQAYEKAGFKFHSRITIYRDPVAEMYKSKPQGLLWKTFRENATMSRVGMPEYLMVYKKWDVDCDSNELVTHPKDEVPLEKWQDLASPVWKSPDDDNFSLPYCGNVWNLKDPGMGDGDLPRTDVLNTKSTKDEKAERHLCPMPLNITKRAVDLWTNKGDVVYSPFGGVGSEGVAAIARDRKFIGVELHPAYYNQAIKNLKDTNINSDTKDMFEELEKLKTGF